MPKLKKILYFIFSIYCSIVSPAFAQVYNYYYGNIHAHTGYSDGNAGANPAYGSAKACYQYAQQSLHTDYFGISEHNHSMAGMVIGDYHKAVREADSVNQNNVFTTLLGMEYGVISNGGHVLVYGIDSLIGWESGNYDIFNSEYDYNSLFTLIAGRQNAFAYLAHMNATDYGNLLGQPYNAIWDQAIVGLAMKSGPAFSTDTTYNNPSTSTYTARFQDLLKKGYHVSVGIDQDSHYITFDRSSKGRTVVLAASLTRAAILDAFRQRRFYASEDWNAHANFSINNHVMGSIFNDVSNPAIGITMTDPDGEAISSIKIWYGVPGSGINPTVLASNLNSSSLYFTHNTLAGSTYYYYAEITQADGDKIWTAPIWMTKNSTPLPVELLQFSAERRDKSVLLSWATGSEINNDHFSIMHAGTDNAFTEICNVPGNGNTSSIHSYNIQDNNPQEGINYYRLDQVDVDGTISKLKTVAVDFSDKIFNVNVFPNPVTGPLLNIYIQSEMRSSVSIQLYNCQGKPEYSSEEQLNKGFNIIQINKPVSADGIYLLKIFENSTGETWNGKIEFHGQ